MATRCYCRGACSADRPFVSRIRREHNVRHRVGPDFKPHGHSVGLHIAYFDQNTNYTIRCPAKAGCSIALIGGQADNAKLPLTFGRDAKHTRGPR